MTERQEPILRAEVTEQALRAEGTEQREAVVRDEETEVRKPVPQDEVTAERQEQGPRHGVTGRQEQGPPRGVAEREEPRPPGGGTGPQEPRPRRQPPAPRARRGLRDRVPLRLRRPVPWHRQGATWREAKPAVIAQALAWAHAQPSGNWYVLAASTAIGDGAPLGRTVAGREVVVWRNAAGRLVAGPGACPHLGAPLRESPVVCGTLVCHWHGLALDGGPFAGWAPYPVHDDGVLVWVRLDGPGGEPPLEEPVLPARPDPARSVAAVYTTVGTCEPEDVVANRLDPWHGAWFHPYSFVDLTVRGQTGDQASDVADGFAVDVAFKVAGRAVVPVRAVFTTPEPRTVVMHITEGEGVGSVVETHATPLGPDAGGNPRTAVTEAVIATSERPGFAAARAVAPLLRPLMRRTAGRLWRDDLAYAERRWALRSTGRFPG